jgi:NADH:ubiquinone oxidoreductase subunit 6 (subunit J)
MTMQTAESFYTIQPYLFWLLAGLTGLSALATVVTQNIVRAATWLLFTLAGTSGVFFLLGADLVGATQLLVYVGGTLILVVFGVMLTAQGPFITMKTSGAEWAISVVAGMLLLGVLMTAIVSHSATLGPPKIRGEEDIAGKGRIRMWITPEVQKYAPELSRAEHAERAYNPRDARLVIKDIKGALEGVPKGPVGFGAKGGGGPKPGKGPQDKGKPKELPPIPDLPKLGKDVDLEAIEVGAAGILGTAAKTKPEPLNPATSAQSTTLGMGFVGVPVGPAHRSPNPPVDKPTDRSPEKRVVRANYLLPFEIVSVHLLVVLIGAAYLARAKRRRGSDS